VYPAGLPRFNEGELMHWAQKCSIEVVIIWNLNISKCYQDVARD
jgi:hypothetical protein